MCSSKSHTHTHTHTLHACTLYDPGMPVVIEFCWKGGNTGFPVRAPPAIRKGDFVLSNTPVIMAYLGRQFGLMPGSLEDAAHVEQVLAIVTDAVAEGRLAFHPKVRDGPFPAPRSALFCTPR
ncbi:hypothetical protein Vretimale_744 [Volvox reticuliferus]|uniref:GST N-terminal domain-containing protein n=1 Tax=Volvox reticuliferus TaxID=1737510 RepID=A0A8J4D4A2_9CHLO|nr:hypothetical protein Vretimale_744 [Volvox reticuliferus]